MNEKEMLEQAGKLKNVKVKDTPEQAKLEVATPTLATAVNKIAIIAAVLLLLTTTVLFMQGNDLREDHKQLEFKEQNASTAYRAYFNAHRNASKHLNASLATINNLTETLAGAREEAGRLENAFRASQNTTILLETQATTMAAKLSSTSDELASLDARHETLRAAYGVEINKTISLKHENDVLAGQYDDVLISYLAKYAAHNATAVDYANMRADYSCLKCVNHTHYSVSNGVVLCTNETTQTIEVTC